jgi:hypothetical protein
MDAAGQREKGAATVRIAQALPEDADVIAVMVGELLDEIMAAVREKAFNFHQEDTAARARGWLSDGSYVVLLARVREAAVGFRPSIKAMRCIRQASTVRSPNSMSVPCIVREE